MAQNNLPSFREVCEGLEDEWRFAFSPPRHTLPPILYPPTPIIQHSVYQPIPQLAGPSSISSSRPRDLSPPPPPRPARLAHPSMSEVAVPRVIYPPPYAPLSPEILPIHVEPPSLAPSPPVHNLPQPGSYAVYAIQRYTPELVPVYEGADMQVYRLCPEATYRVDKKLSNTEFAPARRVETL